MEIIIDKIKYELRTEENGAYVVENHYSGEVRIPAHILVDGQSIPVIGIEEDAFYGCDDVKSITLPQGLRRIHHSAFESMSELREIVIPESVTYIGENAFSDCDHLLQITLPSHLQHLSANLFESCGALEQIHLPKGVKTIGEGCFAACTKLRTIVLPEGLEQIASRAFAFCESLVDIHLPSSVQEIGEEAFYSCLSLQRIALPEGLAYIPVNCFGLCQSLEQVDIPASVQMVEQGAFDLTPYKRHGIHYAHDLLVGVGRVDTPDGVLTISDDTRVVCDTAVSDYDNTLRRVVCPSSLRQIGRNAFCNSANLEEVVLNEGLEFIDGGAFAECKSLKRIYIPSTVRRIESNPFSCCDMLEEIIVSPDNPYFDSRDNCHAIIETASNRLISACKTSFIPDTVEVIGEVAFAAIATLERLTLPESVKRIEWNAFNGCENLREIVFPKDLAYVGEDAFHHTPWLKNQPKGMVMMGKVLYQYRSFNTANFEPDCIIPEGIEAISPYAFCNLANPMRIFLPKSLKSYTPGALVSFEYDAIIVRPEGVGDDYPYADTSVRSAWIGDLFYVLYSHSKTATVVRPYDRSLYRGRIVIPERVTYEGESYTVTCIGYRAFAFDGQYMYEVGESDGAYAASFPDSFELQSPYYIELPASVRCIEDEAFLSCFDLRGVALLGQVEKIGRRIMDKCDNLQFILVPTDLKPAYAEELAWHYREHITDHVCTIDGISYSIDTLSHCATVISPLHHTTPSYTTLHHTTPYCTTLPHYHGHVRIPQQVEYEGQTYDVTKIANYAFFGSHIEEIDLPEGLTQIGQYAFGWCDELREIVLPSSVRTVGKGGCFSCDKLRFAKMSESMFDVPDDMFAGCDQLLTVILSNNTLWIGQSAFEECASLRAIYLPASLHRIEDSAFRRCISLEEVRLPDGMKKLDMNIFEGCDGLERLIIGPNIQQYVPMEDPEDDEYPLLIVPEHMRDTYQQMGMKVYIDDEPESAADNEDEEENSDFDKWLDNLMQME